MSHLPDAERPERPTLVTHVGHSEHDEHHFRGYRVFEELAGREPFWTYASLAVGGPRVDAAMCGVLDDLTACVLAADARIPPPKLTHFAGAYGGAMATFGTAYTALDGALLGPWPTRAAAELLRDLAHEVEGSTADEAAVGAALAPRLVRGRQLVGFGVPARKVDERVRALGRCLEARGRADGRHWQLLMTAQGVLGRPANIAGGVGAVLLDLGYEPRQAPFMTSCFVVPTLLAHAIEAAETQAEILRHIPEAWVDYVGEGPRPSPRALAAAKG